MKCGRDVQEGSVFCADCLTTAKNYPVKPGTAIHLPQRSAVQEKRPLRWRREPSAKEQLARLRISIRRLRGAVLLLSLSLFLAVALLVLFTLDPSVIPSPG